MPVLRETIEVTSSVSDAFDAVANFANAERWDPGVVSSRLVQEGQGAPTGVGAEYEVRVRFRGKESDMTYRTTVFERPHKVVLVGSGPRIRAVDTIEFTDSGDSKVQIAYSADLRLTGLAALAAPLLRSAFDDLGRDALAGMRAWFENGAAASPG